MNARWVGVCLIGCTACGGDTSPVGTTWSDGGTSSADAHESADGDRRDAAPPPLGSKIASVRIVNESARGALSDVFVTFAHPFKPADLPSGTTLVGRTSDGAAVDLQVDAKARHADGSLRHAVITARMPAVPSAGSAELQLFSATASDSRSALAASDLLATPFDTTVSIAIGGTTFSASARSLLATDATHRWLEGPLASEWTVSVPLAASGSPHPHLFALFDVRAYAGMKTVDVSVTVENDWAYEPGPSNLTYDVAITTDQGMVFSSANLVHYTQARWRRTFVWGDDMKVAVQHDPKYLMATGAVPNFDPAIAADEGALAKLEAPLSGAAGAPLGIGLATAYMPETGGRGDIGLLPSWASLYVISGDARARRATLGTADRAGSWSIHYRDKTTGHPVSLDDHPNMTLLGTPSDTCDPKTGQCDSFPACGGDCASPYTPDSAHQPSLAYVPYLLTGDRYYLEELEFWANWNMLEGNPGYRGQQLGLVHWDQPRGQGWSLRTLGQIAYIAPDADPMKKYFVDRVGHNLAWYDEQYTNNAAANPLGYLINGSTVGDDGTIAPWMDDFFTSSLGWLVALGFDDARPLLAWKSRFAIGRMMDPGYCWIFASAYHMAVRDPVSKSFYPSWADVYGPTLADAGNSAAQSLACASADMAAVVGLKANEMVGYSESAEGYPSNLQPALAAAAESGAAQGRAAWDKFMSRSVKPDYSSEPQFAIVPR